MWLICFPLSHWSPQSSRQSRRTFQRKRRCEQTNSQRAGRTDATEGCVPIARSVPQAACTLKFALTCVPAMTYQSTRTRKPPARNHQNSDTQEVLASSRSENQPKKSAFTTSVKHHQNSEELASDENACGKNGGCNHHACNAASNV